MLIAFDLAISSIPILTKPAYDIRKLTGYYLTVILSIFENFSRKSVMSMSSIILLSALE